jgi:unsaturated rhamnogalacturonyl hydrolase
MTNATATTLTVDLAEQLIRRMTDGLVNIVDEKGEFLLHRECFFPSFKTILIVSVVEDGSIIDTKGWGGWEWTHGVGEYFKRCC